MLNRHARSSLCTVLCAAALLFVPARLAAQDKDQLAADRERAVKLMHEGNAAAALPLLEKLTEALPADGALMFYLGVAVLANGQTVKEAEARKQVNIRGRAALLRAKELGFNDPLLESLLESLPPSGEAKEAAFSANKEADAAMRAGETAFARGALDEALAAYKHALELDPKLYEAALFAGDSLMQKGQLDQAGEWYARAVSINPDRETAYRYSATPLMKQGKLAEARARYIEAVVAEPYNRLAWGGLAQWAQAANVALAHPRVDIPTSVTPLKDNKLTINLDPSMLDDKKDNTGRGAWMFYGITRAAWATSEFTKAYPNEKTYRHSLREEAAALGGVIEAVKQRQKDKQIKELDPSLANLVKLNDAGLLEAYILFARADEGIAQDYEGYRKENRDKLRRYLVEYVTANKQ
jgi:tetratricopeptide (TPR) repeat protein